MSKVGVVIVTQDRPAKLQQTLESVGFQESKPPWSMCRIVLFDDRSEFHNHQENKTLLALSCKDSPLPMEWEYERSLIPKCSPAYYWKTAIDRYIGDVDLVAFIPDTCSLLPNWFDALARPIRTGEVEWTWGKVETWREGKIAKRWGGDLNVAQLRHNNYIHLAGAMFSRAALEKLNPVTPNDLGRFHYNHELVLRAATGLKGKHIPESVAIDNPVGPYPEEELAALHPNEQRIHLGWWTRQREKICEVDSSRVSR